MTDEELRAELRGMKDELRDELQRRRERFR